jgi:hypothetical protein
MKYFLFNCVLFFILLANYDIQAQDRLYHNEFPLQDVTLLDGPFKHARDLNIQTLLKYDACSFPQRSRVTCKSITLS